MAESVADRLQVVVTVGMGPYPFDRLLNAVRALCDEHDVFVQTGTSTVRLPCPSAPSIGFEDLSERIRKADVVVTHGGNTVRLAQRVGRVPVAIARESARGEMRNDHQVDYLDVERRRGRVVVLDGDLSGLAAAVRVHPATERRMLELAPPLPLPDPAAAGRLLDRVLRTATPPHPVRSLRGWNRFAVDPRQRLSWAFAQLEGTTGRHLHLGIGHEQFTAALSRGGGLDVVTADRTREPLPFANGSFDSASLLDSPPSAPHDEPTLREVARVLRSGGLLVLTAPLHSAPGLLELLTRCGLQPVLRDGGRLFGRGFHRGEMFLVAERRG